MPIFAVSEAMSLVRAVVRLSKARNKQRVGDAERRTRRADDEERDGPPTSATAALWSAAARSLRRGAGLAALAQLVHRAHALQHPRVAIFAVAAAMHRLLPSVPWSFAVFVLMRTMSRAARGARRAYHLTPAGVFLLHCAHNWLMTYRADWVSPGYISAWLGMVSSFADVGEYVAAFGSRVTTGPSPCWPEEMTTSERLARIPRAALATLRAQLPFVAAAYGLPMALRWRSVVKRARRNPGGLRAILSVKVVAVLRSAVVLALLPYALIEFPALYAAVTGRLDTKVRRQQLLHTVVSSLLSTPIFLAEPSARMETLVAYTAYRVVEAMLRRFVLKRPLDDRRYAAEEPDEAWCGSLCVAAVAAAS